MGRGARIALAAAAAALTILALLAGCAPKGPTYVENGSDYSTKAAYALLARVDAGKLADTPTTDGPRLRHIALAALRRNGPVASSAADTITKTFPSDVTGVPVYVERGAFGGKPAIVLVEAIGPANGKLTSKRIWFVSENGDILFAGSR